MTRMVLTDEEIDLIAEKAAEKAIARMTGMMYQEVGKTVINKFLFLLGVGAVGLLAFLRGKGVL